MSQPEDNCISCGAPTHTTHLPDCTTVQYPDKCIILNCPAAKSPANTSFCPFHASRPHLHNDPVNHPQHYTDVVPGIECINVVKHFSFVRGNAIKYLWRAGAKGDLKQDLEKARWYIDQELRDLR